MNNMNGFQSMKCRDTSLELLQSNYCPLKGLNVTCIHTHRLCMIDRNLKCLLNSMCTIFISKVFVMKRGWVAFWGDYTLKSYLQPF